MLSHGRQLPFSVSRDPWAASEAGGPGILTLYKLTGDTTSAGSWLHGGCRDDGDGKLSVRSGGSLDAEVPSLSSGAPHFSWHEVRFSTRSNEK